MRMSFACWGVRRGWASNICAAMLATIGAAKLVPSTCLYEPEMTLLSRSLARTSWRSRGAASAAAGPINRLTLVIVATRG